jgi:hypothetical protein
LLPKKIPKKPYRTRRDRDCVARLLCPKRDPIPLSLATYDRIDELTQPTLDELPCLICGGVGLPKIEGTDMRICVVCRDALRDIPRPDHKALIDGHDGYMLYRMPFFRQYLVAGRWETDDNQLNRIA